MPGTFSPPPTSKETTSYRSRHASRHVRHARAVVHVGIANPRWRRKGSSHTLRMRNPQFYVSGKMPMDEQRHPLKNYSCNNLSKAYWHLNHVCTKVIFELRNYGIMTTAFCREALPSMMRVLRHHSFYFSWNCKSCAVLWPVIIKGVATSKMLKNMLKNEYAALFMGHNMPDIDQDLSDATGIGPILLRSWVMAYFHCRQYIMTRCDKTRCQLSR